METSDFETEILASLQKIADEHQQSSDDWVAEAASRVITTCHIQDALEASLELVVALEALSVRLHSLTDDAARDLRAAKYALLEALNATTGTITHGPHRASVVTPKPRAIVTDRHALPADCLRHVPNLDAIRDAISNGRTVPGTAMDNGTPYLRISTRSSYR